jgi:AcrR family transcriptional regulator
VPLTRQRLLDVALEMIDSDGVDALSMRRLGHAVDRDPMRLYRYAESKSALLDAVTELVLADFVVPAMVDGDWEAALREAARNYRRIALAHPKVVPLLVTRPLSTPLGLRPPGTLRSLESLLDLFTRAGFDATGALHAYRLFTGFLNGHVLNDVQELVQDPDESDAVLRFGLHHLDRNEFSRTRALASTLAGYDGTTELEMGLDIIIAGLRSNLAASGTSDDRTEPDPEETSTS